MNFAGFAEVDAAETVPVAAASAKTFLRKKSRNNNTFTVKHFLFLSFRKMGNMLYLKK